MSSNSTLYFDYAATTPLDKEVLEAMLPFLTTEYGNANSAHHLGQRAKVIVEDSRANCRVNRSRTLRNHIYLRWNRK